MWFTIAIFLMFMARSILFGRGGVNPVVTILMFFLAIAAFIGGAVWMSTLSSSLVVPVVGLVLAFTIVDLHSNRGGGVKRRRVAAGCCPACGYDLRESVDGCPECGGGIPEELARRRRWQARIAARQASVPQSPPPEENVQDERAA